MNNLNHVDLLLTAEDHTVDLADLATDPKMQMRVTMDQDTIEQYAEKIDAILEEKPIDVVVVDVNGYETWYVVDGFHRYHAAQLAECRAVRVRLMKGTYEQALLFAMSANWKNGLRPKPEDATRSVHMLLSIAPDFGFDSKAVNKWVTSFGIPASTARNHTKEMVEQVKAKRDAEILRLSA